MWVTLIMAAVEAAQKYFESRDTAKWQASVSSKLDEILIRFDEIDAFLETLPSMIIRDMEWVTRKEWATELQARIIDINDLIRSHPKGPSSQAQKQRWTNAFDTTKTLIEKNTDYLNWGFEQFAIVAAGLAAITGLALFETDKQLYKSLVIHGIDYFNRAIDPKTAISFAAVNTTSVDFRNRVVAANDKLFNNWYATGRSTPDDEPHPEPSLIVGHSYTVFLIEGSVETGVGTVRLDDVRTPPPQFPGTSNGAHREDEAKAILTVQASQCREAMDRIDRSQQCINLCSDVIGKLQKLL